MVKVSMSSENVKGPQANMISELPGWNFDKIQEEAKIKWNNYLSRVDIKGDTDKKTLFYYVPIVHPVQQYCRQWHRALLFYTIIMGYLLCCTSVVLHSPHQSNRLISIANV